MRQVFKEKNIYKKNFSVADLNHLHHLVNVCPLRTPVVRRGRTKVV